MKESQLVNLILRFMHYQPRFKVWRANSGSIRFERKDGSKGYMRGNIPGTPDVIGIGPGGRFVGIEAKVGKNTLRDTQERFQADCTRLGGFYAVVHSLDELQAALSEMA